MFPPRLIFVRVVSLCLLISISVFINNSNADSFPGGVNHRVSVQASNLTQYLNATTGTVLVRLEEPVADEIHGGVGNLRGWAIASDGIEKVEIWIDGAYSFDVPYGGARGDVGNRYPEIADSSESGFSLAWNYNVMGIGVHTISAVAYDASGVTDESIAEFEVVKFSEDFISGANAVDLSGGSCAASGDQISIVDALVNGTLYDLVLKWRAAEQGFEIVEIR